jgi:type IV pilus assembly protein PilE
MRHQKGFTLIELVVTMLIVAILASIAIPAYSNYTRKAHRTDAKSALLDLASVEERFFSTQNIYSSTWSDLGYAGATGTSISVGNGYYTVAPPALLPALPPSATSVGTPATYSVTATAVGDQLKDTPCNTFTVTSAGVRSSADASNNVTTSTCW